MAASRLARGALLVGVALMLGACSSGGDDDGGADGESFSDPDATEEEAEGDSAPAGGAAEPASGGSEPADTITEEDLEDGLLTVGDLPPGFTKVESEPPTDEAPLCEAGASAFAIDHVESVQIRFEPPDGGTSLGMVHHIELYEAGDAEEEMEALRSDVDTCPATVQPDGTELAVAPLEVPDLGDEAFGFRLTTSGSAIDIVAVRTDDIISYITSAGRPVPDQEVRDELLGVAEERVDEIG